MELHRVLQDTGLRCFEYVEQLTLLQFLKMADRQTEPPYKQPAIIPGKLGWKALLTWPSRSQPSCARELNAARPLEASCLLRNMNGLERSGDRAVLYRQEAVARPRQGWMAGR